MELKQTLDHQSFSSGESLRMSRSPSKAAIVGPNGQESDRLPTSSPHDSSRSPTFLTPSLDNPWTARYAKFLALILLYGATVHIGNMAGLTGTPWLSTPLLWRSMDVVLLIFDGVSAIALWRGFSWSAWLTFGGIALLQFVPYTLFRSHFILQPEDAQTLNGLLGTEALLMGVFSLLLWRKK